MGVDFAEGTGDTIRVLRRQHSASLSSYGMWKYTFNAGVTPFSDTFTLIPSANQRNFSKQTNYLYRYEPK
jgi:hypothetical protein